MAAQAAAVGKMSDSKKNGTYDTATYVVITRLVLALATRLTRPDSSQIRPMRCLYGVNLELVSYG